jgi:glycine cleavage system H protein
MDLFDVGSHRLAAPYHYDAATHLWLDMQTEDEALCGFDPLGSETVGDIVALSFESVGADIRRGRAFGSLEAAKFVGPLNAPISGRITAHNANVLARPGLVNQAPLEHWLIRLELTDAARELPLLIHGRERVSAWFESEQKRFKQKGMIAE